MQQQPFSIYSTWGYHDELGDRARLDEKMVMSALDTLEVWKRDHGLRQEYFHIDCFWFDPAGGYRTFHPETWPRGFEPALERILAAGMTPGLWYSTNGWHLNPPRWRESADGSGIRFSLAEGPYADEFEAAVMMAAESWHVRLLKFDFAAFGTRAKGSSLSLEETYRRSQERFLLMVRRLRERFPDVFVITHFGCWRGHASTELGASDRFSPELSFLAGADRVFCGDPQHFSAPQTSITRNLDLFQDRNVWKMMREGYPIDRIDDHGALIGTTNTCHYRGRRGFRRTHIAQLARGGRRDLFYGNPSLLTTDDLVGMKRARALFFDAFARGLTTTPVGSGEPGLSPWHGYLTGEGSAGALYLVNPHLDPATAELTIQGLTNARLLFHDGAEPASVQSQPDRLRVRLLPEQAVVVGFGEYAQEQWALGNDPEVPLPLEARPVSVSFRADTGSNASGYFAELDTPPAAGELLSIRVRAYDHPAGSIQERPPIRFARQDTKQSPDMTPKAHADVEIVVEVDGKPIAPVSQLPDVPIWPGVTWVARDYLVDRPCTIRIRQRLDPARKLSVAAFAIRYEEHQPQAVSGQAVCC